MKFLDEFKSWPQGFYPGVTELLHQLRFKYKLACLSNSNSLHWARFDGFQEYFDVALSSHLLKVIKPDAACFRRVLLECESEPGEVLFFDDALVNVEAARACGIRSLHVRNFDEVKFKVNELRLLSPTDA
jgi:putative hydrolase of the HAD superfamily